MTERMENALRHIKTSVDVDPWAIEEVERVFKGIDDAIAEIEHLNEYDYPKDDRTISKFKDIVIGIIRSKTGVKDE